jgi:hypothetical protein
MELIKTRRFGNCLCSRPQVIKNKIKIKMEEWPTQLGPLDWASLNPRTIDTVQDF